jgi:hypothetical protein
VDDTSFKRGWFKDGFEAMGLPSILTTRLTKVELVIYAMWSMAYITLNE